MLSSNEGCRSKPSVSHAEQPDIVVGDVNSTMVCTITAKKLGIRVAHVEAGRRSRDMGVPEEIIGSAPMCYVI
jgi:UDP-N-acetylglucosamine 2-epimerase